MAEGPAPPPGPLTPQDLALFQKIAANPTDLVSGQLRGYLEDFVRVTMGAQKNWTPPVGSPLMILTDLTAQTGEYIYTDEQGIKYLYCNGVAVSRTTYADLFALTSTSFGVGDGSTTFNLPDCRGRSLFYCGTHANADMGDNDGATETTRQAKHAHTNGVTGSITGAPSIGSLAITGAPAVGTLATTATATTTATTSAIGSGGVDGVATNPTGAITGAPAIGTLAVSGAPGAGTLGVSVGGTVGTGTSGDAPAHLFIGSLLVRF